MTSNTPPTTGARRRLYMSLRAKEHAIDQKVEALRKESRKFYPQREVLLAAERDSIRPDHVLTFTQVPTPQDNPFFNRTPRYAAFCSCGDAQPRYAYRMSAKEKRRNGGYLGEYKPHSRIEALMAHEGHVLTTASKRLGERDD